MLQDFPTFSSFAAAASQGNLVASFVTIPFDHETAVTLADRFKDEAQFYLLESAAAGPGSVARFSFLGFDPLASFSLRAGIVSEEVAGHQVTRPLASGEDVTAALRRFMQKLSLVTCAPPKVSKGPQLAGMGGAVGYLSFDAAATMEPSVGALPPKRLGLADAYFFVPRNFFVLDQLTRRLTLVRYTTVASTERTALTSLYEVEKHAVAAIFATLSTPHHPAALRLAEDPVRFEAFAQTFTKDKFLAGVERCLAEIRAGEIFQVQIGNRLSCKTAARPFDIFRHLRMLNPSPYMFFYKFGGEHILGASPEIMVGLDGQRVVQRPIAGTRRRTWNAADDLKMRHELTTSEKERAEHVMLIDLSRNDIGRIAAPGTVKVEELMVVEEYSHVFHMVSQVVGDKRDDVDAFDIMRASFPNGTVCGAPKIRAIQLINELEPCAREFYAGSLGIFDFSGNLKSTILIRSIHCANGTASTQASAGIVYDSVPEQEWLETRNKMAACLTAMQNTN